MGTSASKEVQALDGESELREEGGNEAVDTDSMWEELEKAMAELNKMGEESQSNTKVVSDDKAEDVGVITDEATTEASSVGSWTIISSLDLVGPSAGALANSLGAVAWRDLLSTAPVVGVLTSGGYSPVSSDVGTTGRRSGITNEESPVGKDGELIKETELDGLRPGLMDSVDPSVFEHEEKKISPSSAEAAILEPGKSSNLGADVSSFGGSGNIANGGDGGASSSPSRPILVEAPVNPSRLRFFVQKIPKGRTVVIRANQSDSIESVHQQIFRKTGLPVLEQSLLFRGHQLRHDETLESLNVVNDDTMSLVGSLRRTSLLPFTCRLIFHLDDTVHRILSAVEDSPAHHVELLRLQDSVRASLQEIFKMASNPASVSDHMQVFQLSGATCSLVRLLQSEVESNRECAEEAITCFLTANDEYLPARIHCHCASVLLDFCKLLSKKAPNHSLYSSCRNALARILDTLGIAHGSPYFYNAKAENIVRDFSPFVNELSLRLSADLEWIAKTYTTKGATVSFTPYMKEAKDFTAFVIPLCKAMEVCEGMDLSGSTNTGRSKDGPSLRYSKNDGTLLSLAFYDVPLVTSSSSATTQDSGHVDSTANSTRGMGVEIGTHAWLRTLFLELLEAIDNCLKVVDEEAVKCSSGESKVVLAGIEKPLGWAPFLVILKGLHAIAKLHAGDMDELLTLLSRRSTALCMLIKQSRWQEDGQWLLEHKSLLDFDSKRSLVMAMLPEPQDDHDKRQEMVFHRSQVLSESFKFLAYVEPHKLLGGISVQISEEEGVTGPGVLQEWFSMICREVFYSQTALFLPCPKDRRRLFPNFAAGINRLISFRFCGRVIALALMHKVQVDVSFAETFFKQLAGLPISWEDAKDVDPMLYEYCKKILEIDPQVLDTNFLGQIKFDFEVEELGTRKTVEVCPGGTEMVVTSGNRKQFVELLAQKRLVEYVSDQMKSFSQGFSDLLVNGSPQQFFGALDPEDLDMFLHGKDWKTHTE